MNTDGTRGYPSQAYFAVLDRKGDIAGYIVDDREGEITWDSPEGKVRLDGVSASWRSILSGPDRTTAIFASNDFTAIDTLDVKRDQFLVAGDAWRHCRAGNLDPKSFGILDMWGYWFIASNVIRDLAALNNREMLPWDVWGAMTQDDSQIDFALFDRLAELTHEPDGHFDELRAIHRDSRFAVPGTVFNAVLNRTEAA